MSIITTIVTNRLSYYYSSLSSNTSASISLSLHNMSTEVPGISQFSQITVPHCKNESRYNVLL